MDARMEAFFPEPEAKPVDSGPAQSHRIHGQIPLAAFAELRVTSQPARQVGDRAEPARIICRTWHYRFETQAWWPRKTEPGVYISARDARAFLAAVTAAVAQLEQDGGGGT
jgi:hypothetical protein